MKSTISRIIVIIVISTFVFPFHLNASGTSQHNFRTGLVIENRKLNLTGEGLLRYWGFKVYTGALYLEEGSTVDQALADRAKRIEIEYLRPIRKEDFGVATNKNIADNVDKDILERLRPKIEYHNSLYEDVQPGDRYSLTYIPGRGTELALNGETKGVIEGADFAAALFSVWLGPDPINRSFKEQILGL
jgi:hypothetical protein